MKIIKFITIIVFILCSLISCDHGVDPKNEDKILQGISGTIYFENWPQQNTLLDLRLIVFSIYPPGDIFTEVTQGRAVVHPALGSSNNLPYNVDSTDFTVELNTGTYEYIVIAQQFDTNVLEDWRAVGQYDTTSFDTIPTPIEIISNSIYSDMNIYVDFDSLPGQPF